MASLADLLRHVKETGETLSTGYPNAKRFADALLANVERNVPTTQELQNPAYMQQRSLNYMSPMAGVVYGYGNAKDIAEKLNEKYGQIINSDITGDKKGLSLDKLIVNPENRNQGFGGQFMQDLISYANEADLPLRLTAAGDFGGNKAGQMRFYKQHGFIENKGKNKNFEFMENMYKLPKN